MSDYTPPFNVNVHLLTFNLVQREHEVKSVVTALEVDRHGAHYGQWCLSLTFGPPEGDF